MSSAQPRRPRSRGSTDAYIRSQGKTPLSRDRLNCIHLLGNTGESVGQTGCGGCGSDQASVWECELHGDCAPLARGTLTDDKVRKCLDCGDYNAKLSPRPPQQPNDAGNPEPERDAK